MEKIILVINRENPDASSIYFACNMAALNQCRLTGVFLENLLFDDTTGKKIDGPFFLETVTETVVQKNAAVGIENAVTIFKEECLRKGVDYEISVVKNELVKNIVYQSRYADILIIDPEIGLYDPDEKLPSHFAKEILAKAECPVLLAPQTFGEINETVFCYNNSASSVFAIKQFTYLFPQFRYKPVTLLEVNDAGHHTVSAGHVKLLEWLRANYNSVSYKLLRGDVEEELVNYFLMKKNKLIVMGAYGRSMLSSFVKRSSADALIRILDLPIFITHH